MNMGGILSELSWLELPKAGTFFSGPGELEPSKFDCNMIQISMWKFMIL